MVIQYHPRIGHLYVPRIRARVPHERGAYLVRTNSSGFRSDIEFTEQRGSRPRILVLGDSYAAGDGCNVEERFTELLGQELSAEVYNYALSGSGPDQQLLIYEDFASKVEADLIIWAIAVHTIERITVAHRPANDRVTGGHVFVPKPYFTIQNGGLRLSHVPVPRLRSQVSEQEACERSQAPLIDRPISERLFQHPRLGWLRAFVNAHLIGLKLRFRSVVYRCAGVQLYDDYSDPASRGWQLMAALIKCLRERAGNVPLLVVPLPTYHYFVDKLEPNYQPLFESLADDKQQLYVHNLTADLARKPLKQRTQYCFENDTHYSPFGHQQLAQHIANAIRQRSLLPTRTITNGDRGEMGLSSKRRNTAGPRQRFSKPSYVLGISCFGQESAAALIKDGEIMAAVQEERLTRTLRDRRFPHQAINYCLEKAQISQNTLAAVVYYQTPAWAFERVVRSLWAYGSEAAWLRVLPSWVLTKLRVPHLIRRHLRYEGLLLQTSAARSHCASAFYMSPFDSAAILAVDAVMDGSTSSIGTGQGKRLQILKEMAAPHSLGVLSAALTRFIGLRAASNQEDMNALAQSGEPRFVNIIMNRLMDLKDDGSVELHPDLLEFADAPPPINTIFAQLFEGPSRGPNTEITRREADLAKSMQVIAEETVVRMARHAHQLTGHKNLCLAGNVALSAARQTRLSKESAFESVWAHPAAGDAGCAVGAALDAYHNYFDGTRVGGDFHSRWGPGFSEDEVHAFVETFNFPYSRPAGQDRITKIVNLLAEGKLVAWMDDRLEFGTSSLRSRSLIGDVSQKEVRTKLGYTKGQKQLPTPRLTGTTEESVCQSFAVTDQGELPAREERPARARQTSCVDVGIGSFEKAIDMPTEIGDVQSPAPVSWGTAKGDHSVYDELRWAYRAKKKDGQLVYFEFKLHDEPVVCTPLDAYDCFMRSESDVLVIGTYLLLKREQPVWSQHARQPKLSHEHDDAYTRDEPFICELDKICKRKLVPLSKGFDSSVDHAVCTPFGTAKSQWRDVAPPASLKELFPVPAELHGDVASPQRVAEAITRQWRPDQVTDAFRPILTTILKLRARFASDFTG